jgi:hypothetical protein
MLLIAELSNGQVCGRGSQFSRRASAYQFQQMNANEEDLVAKLPTKPGMNVRGKERTDKVAEVLDAVHVRNGARDQKYWHRVRPLSLQGRRTRTANKKPFRSGRNDFGIGSHLACADAHRPLPPDLVRSGRDIRAMASKIKDHMQALHAIGRNHFCGPSARKA